MSVRIKKNGISGIDYEFKPNRCDGTECHVCHHDIPKKQSVFSVTVKGTTKHVCAKCARWEFDKVTLVGAEKKSVSKVKKHRIQIVSQNIAQLVYVGFAIGGTIEHDGNSLKFVSDELTSCYAGGHVFDEFRGQMNGQTVSVLDKRVRNLEEYHKVVKSTSDWNESLR